MSESEIVIKLSAKNLTAAGFAEARKEIAGLKDATKQATDKTSMLSTGMSALGGSLKIVGIIAGAVVGAITAVTAEIIALAKRGSEINDVRENFDLLNSTIGNDSKQVIQTLSTAVDGMVSK